MANDYNRTLTTVGDEAEQHMARLRQLSAEDQDAKEDKTTETERKKKLVERAINCFKLAATAEADQRRREEEDLQFDRALPEDQWPDDIRVARGGGVGPDGFTVSQRPCLVINKLDQPVQQVINEARNAHVGIQVKPKADADKEDAELRQGLYRTIEMNSRANVARLWALERAVKCGRGFYRVVKKYANDGDFDIDLVIERILNQASVYLDPYAVEPDWSDGEWALITSDLPMEEYKRRYPKSKMANASADQLTTTGDRVPGWVGTTDQALNNNDSQINYSIRVAEYFYVEHTSRTLLFFNDQKIFQDELPEGVEVPPGVKSRQVDQREVKWCVINAEEVLEEEDWQGRYIPIVPVLGKEYNVNGDRCFKGVISNSKDAQRSYNYMRSAQVEAVGLAPKAPWIMAEGQDEGYEAMWDQSNTRNYTRLKYKPVDFNGEALPPPQRNVAEPAIQAISQAVNMADNDIKSTTGRFDPSLGRSRQDQSGKAIMALKESGESTTSNYLEQLTYVSMHYEAKVILDLMPFVYDRPGRIIRVLGEEDHQDQTVMLNQPFIQGPQGPQPAPSPQMMQRLQQSGQQMPQPKYYNLTKGDFGIEIEVGRSFPTQRAENESMLRSLIEAAPALTPVLADLLVEQIDTPIAKRAAARLRKMNPQAEGEEGDQPQIPPQVQQQMQQLQQQHDMLTKALEQANEEIKTQKYKVDVDAQMRGKEIAARIEVAKIQAGAAVQNTTLKVQTEEDIAHLKAAADAREQAMDQHHEQRMTFAGQAHERELSHEDKVHERASQIADQHHERTESDQERRYEAVVGARQNRHEAMQADDDRDHQARERALGQAHDLAEGDRERQYSSAEAGKDRKHSETQADKDRKQADKDRAAKAKSSKKE